MLQFMQKSLGIVSDQCKVLTNVCPFLGIKGQDFRDAGHASRFPLACLGPKESLHHHLHASPIQGQMIQVEFPTMKLF